jgi:hypothetical protein
MQKSRDQMTSPTRQQGEGGQSPRADGLLTLSNAELAAPDTAVGAHLSKACTRRWPPPYPGSAEALALLTLRPVQATPLPRHHVALRAPDGNLVVDDRATGERFVVYLPRFVYQFHAGHHAGQWYLRPVVDVGSAPQSAGFPGPRAAVEALRSGRWKLPHGRIRQSRKSTTCRIIWS